MSKHQKTPVPLPGAKTKTSIPLPASTKTATSSSSSKSKSSSKKTPVPAPSSKKKAIPASQLSEEFVGDSDDSSNEEDATKSSANPTQKTTTIAVHRPKTNGVAQMAAEAKKKKQKEAPKKTVKKAAPTTITAADDSVESSSSSEESSDDAETDIKQAQQRDVEMKDADSSASSSEDTSDESEEESSPAAPAAPSEARATKTHTVAFQQTRQYVPPKDFQPFSLHNATSSSTNMFKDLKGKQIWHITAPEDVPLKSLEQLAMDKLNEGGAVLKHKGASYGLSTTDSAGEGRKVLLPAANGFKAVSLPISHSFNVHQVIDLPKLSALQADQNTGSAAAASITASTIREVKPQRKGLKMRFFPSGFQDSSPATMGESESEDDSAPAPKGLAVPKGLAPPTKKEKRKHRESNVQEELEAPAKKIKKVKTAEEQKRKDEKKAKKDKKKEK